MVLFRLRYDVLKEYHSKTAYYSFRDKLFIYR